MQRNDPPATATSPAASINAVPSPIEGLTSPSDLQGVIDSERLRVDPLTLATEPADVEAALSGEPPLTVESVTPPATVLSRADRIGWYRRRILRSALVYAESDDPLRAASVLRLVAERKELLPDAHRQIITYAQSIAHATGLAPAAGEVKQRFLEDGVVDGMAAVIEMVLSSAMQKDAPSDPPPRPLPTTGVAACLHGLMSEEQWAALGGLAMSLASAHQGTITAVAYRDGRRLTTPLTSPAQVTEWARDQIDRLCASCGMGTSLRVLTRDELRELPPVEWVVPDLIPAAAVIEMYGPPGGKKTFAAVDLACAVVSGQKWLDRFPVARPGPVVYWLGEGIHDINRRIAAWETARGWNDHERAAIGNLDGLFMVGPGQPLNLGESSSVDALVRTIRQAGARLLIVDTRARATVGLEENSATDMGRVVEHLTRVKDATGCTVLTVHHTGRVGSGSRGSNAVDGGLDASLKLASDEKGRLWLTMTKNRYGPDRRTFPVRVIDSGGSVTLSAGIGHDSRTLNVGGARLRPSEVQVLIALLNGPSGPRQIKRDGFSGSLSQVHKVLQSLKERNAVAQVEGRYSLTEAGEHLAAAAVRVADDEDADAA